jgi:hypothetical protein
VYPPQQPYAQYPPPPQRRSRAPIVFGCLGAAALGFVLLLVLAALVSNGTPEPAARSADGPASSKAKEATKAPAKKAAAAMPSIGDTVKDGDLSFTVTKAKPGPKRIGNEYLGETAQGRFYYVYVTVKNHSDEPASFSSYGQNLLIGNKQYAADATAAAYIKGSSSLFTPINPGNEVDGIMVFDVPESAKPAAIELHDSSLSRGVKVSLN